MITIDQRLYAKLLKFGKAGGNPALVGSATGLNDEQTAAYLEHMKIQDNLLWKKWGSKWTPTEEEEDPFADLEPAAPAPAQEEPEEEEDPFGDLENLQPPIVCPEPAVPKAAPGKKVTVSTNEKGDGIHLVPGVTTAVPERFQLRGPDGFNTELEVFSRSPKFGYILRVPVPSDLRTVHIGGKPVEVDLLALRRDPDGLTAIGDKKVANSKLIAACELQED